MQIKNGLPTLEKAWRVIDEAGLAVLFDGSNQDGENQADFNSIVSKLLTEGLLRKFLEVILVEPEKIDNASLDELGEAVADFFLITTNVWLNVQGSLFSSMMKKQKEMTEMMGL